MPLDGNAFKHFITETHHINRLLSATHRHAHTYTHKQVDRLLLNVAEIHNYSTALTAPTITTLL